MNYIWILVPALIMFALIVGGIIYLRNRTKIPSNEIDVAANKEPIEATEAEGLVVASDPHNNAIMIPIELLPATTQLDEKSLAEITDRTVVARISSMLPATVSGAAGGLVSSSANAAISSTANAANAAIKNANEAFKSSGDIYRAVLQNGGEFVKSKSVPDAVRAFTRGTKGITEQANLVKVDVPQVAPVAPTSVSHVATIASTAANVMNVASLVVGQYYMSVITKKLDSMTRKIEKIGDFQKREFKSRIMAVVTAVGVISQFSTEILDDDEQRNRKLSALDGYQVTATELLGQVNITISEITQNNPSADYKSYQGIVEDFSLLIEYQNLLVTVLSETSKLIYLLEKGAISAEYSVASCKTYLGQSLQTRTLLGQWHDKQVEGLRIDLDGERIHKKGLDAILAAPLGLIDDKFNYRELKQGLAHEIRTQAKTTLSDSAAPKSVYDENVEIIIRDGKYYYLPKTSEAE